MAYYETQPLWAIGSTRPRPYGSYYMDAPSLAVGQQSDVVAREGDSCPKGYHPGTIEAAGVSVAAPVCVKRSFNAMHMGVAAVVGFVIGKLL